MTAAGVRTCAEHGGPLEVCERIHDARYLAEMGRRCAWCADPGSDYLPADPERELCLSHLAEHDGLSVAELDRQAREEARDLL